MIAKAAVSMVVLAMHIIGNGPANGHVLCAGYHRQRPAAPHCKALNIAQHCARLTFQNPGAVIERDVSVHSSGMPHHPVRIQADVTITASQAEGQGARCPTLLYYRGRGRMVGNRYRCVFACTQAPPGPCYGHGHLTVPSTSTATKTAPAARLALSLRANTTGSSCILPRCACNHIQLIQNSSAGMAPQMKAGVSYRRRTSSL